MSTMLPPAKLEPAVQPRQGADRPALEAILFYGLAVFIALLTTLGSALAGASVDEIMMIVIALGTILVALLPLAVNHSRPEQRRHMLLMIFSLTFICFYTIPLFTQYFLGDASQEDVARLVNIRPSDIIVGQSVVLLSLLCVYIGYIYPVGSYIGGLFPTPTAEWPHATALFIGIFMIFAGWTVFLGRAAGLIPYNFGSGVLGAIAGSMYFGIGLLTVVYLRYRSQPARLLMFLLVPPTVAIAFLTGSKRFALAPIVLIALAYVVVERRFRPKWVVLGAVALVLLYPVSTFWRFVAWGGPVTLLQWVTDPLQVIHLLGSFMSESNFGEYVRAGLLSTGARLDVLGITTVIVRDTPSLVPYQGGWSLLYIPMSFIPRIIWTGKPAFMTGQWVTDNYGAGPHIISSTGSGWVGELYFNFGLAGVIVGMLIIGIFFRILHETLFRPDATIPVTLASIVVLWTTCPTLEGNLLAPFSGSVFHLAPIFLMHVFVRGLGATTRQVVPKAPTPSPGTT